MTYRTFCTPHQLLDELIHRYRVMEPAGVSPDERKEWEAKKQRPIRARYGGFALSPKRSSDLLTVFILAE